MAEMFHLGFEIDTRPLAQTSNEAAKAADALGKLGSAEQRLATDAQRAADSQRKVSDETSRAARAAQDAARAHDDAAKANRGSADAAQTFEQKLKSLSGNLKVNQQDLQGLAGLLRGQSGLVAGLEGATGAIGRMVGALGPVGMVVAGVAVAVGAAAVAFNSIIKPLAEAEDKMALFDARMKNALGSASAAKDTMQKLYEATQKTGLGFEATADAFLRIARNADRLGATTEELLRLTDTIQKLGAVSGASKGEIGSGMLQLSQALASGKLNGDELRSIMENMPALAKAIADGLGVGVGQMRAMGAAGELSSEKVFKAILKAAEQANKEFAQLPDTVERANQRASDAWGKLLSTMGERFKASELVRDVTNWFTDIVNKATDLIKPEGVQQRIASLQAQRASGGGFFNRLFGGGTAGIDREIATLQEQARKEEEARAKAEAEAEQKRKMAPILSAAELGANEYDDYYKKVKKTQEEIDKLKSAIKALDEPFVSAGERNTLLPSLTRQLGIAQASLDGMAAGLAKVKTELSDARLAALMGGGGGGTSIVANAQNQLRAAREKGVGGNLQGYIAAGVEQAFIKGNEQIATLERQASAQRNLTKAVGESRDVTLELEVANETLTKRIELVGKLGGAGAEAWAKRYAAALRDSKLATDELANAQARLGLNDQINLAQSQLDAVGNPYQQRRIANESQAMIAARRDPQQAALMRRLFGIQEQSNAFAQMDAANRNTAFNNSVIGLSPADLREAELNRRIADAQRNVAPGDRDALGQSMRDEDASNRAREYDAQERALVRAGILLKNQSELLGLMPEQYRLQNALLQKRNELEQAGAPEEVIKRQLQITEFIERQTIAFEKQKRNYDGVVDSFKRLGDGIGGAFQDAIEKGLGNGTKAGLHQFEYSFRTAIRKMGAELTYEIAVRPFVEAIKNMAMAFGQKLATSIFGGGYSYYGSAQGNVFNGVQRFAAGGTFTNSVVNTPTMFAFANGGALGVMGEAGPEAVMPLKRGRDGSLGVAASGGGGDVQVVINDMRQNTQAPEIQVAESRGPDNRRVLQIMVRDEVRRVVRSGELDTEMYSNFGVTRSVARK